MWDIIIGKAVDWLIPNRKEHIANEIEKLQGRLKEISGRKPYGDGDAREYDRVSLRLDELQRKAKNN